MAVAVGDVFYTSERKYLGRSLRELARQVFSDTFSHLYDPEAFADFCDDVYADTGAMATDIADPTVRWRIAIAGNDLIGYAKLTPLRAPALNAVSGALELQQIYVRKDWHGTLVAADLMNWAISSARAADASELYLTVFDHNERAKRFYRRNGFKEVGQCTFTLGDRVDDDRIWMKVLTIRVERDVL